MRRLRFGEFAIHFYGEKPTPIILPNFFLTHLSVQKLELAVGTLCDCGQGHSYIYLT